VRFLLRPLCWLDVHDWKVKEYNTLRNLMLMHLSPLLAGALAECRRCGDVFDDRQGIYDEAPALR
jgi:hypothetical protein